MGFLEDLLEDIDKSDLDKELKDGVKKEVKEAYEYEMSLPEEEEEEEEE